MKATLEFDLDNPDDRIEQLRCLKSLDMAIVLFDIQYNLRKRIEYIIEYNPKEDVIELIFKHIGILMDENSINLDEIIE